MASQARLFHDIITDGLAEPRVTIACGRWADGAIAEMMPLGRARLLPALHDACFAGVRELRLAGGRAGG